MGFVVLHMEKGAGSDSKMSSHIERDSHPKNADETRTHLNKELIEFPEGVRTEAIQHRLKTAGLQRRIGKNQVQAIRIMLSAGADDMDRIRTQGKLQEWCKDSLDYLKEEFGEKNIVSAVLHDDEKTPHIHATLVPIVTGERRKAKAEENNGKKKYRKKNKDVLRLCADDVMARNKLIHYQDSYAEKMQKYGLERGVRGSEARHISTQQYYRDLYVKNENLKEDIQYLQEEKQEVYDSMRNLYDMKDEAREKFLNMDDYLREKEKERVEMEAKLKRLKEEHEPYKVQEALNSIYTFFPIVKEQMRIAELCKQIGLGVEYVGQLLNGKSLKVQSYSFFSPEHNRKFEAKDSLLKVEPEADNPKKTTD